MKNDPFVHWIDHPLVQHKLTLMRRKDASTNSFRTLLNELSMLMAYEVTRDMEVSHIEIETPMETMMAPTIDGKKLALISILPPDSISADRLMMVFALVRLLASIPPARVTAPIPRMVVDGGLSAIEISSEFSMVGASKVKLPAASVAPIKAF